MYIYFVIPAIFMIPVGIYMYHFIKRIVSVFCNFNEKCKKGISIGISLLVMIPALNIWTLQAVIVLYVAGISLVISLLRYLVLKIIKVQNKRLNVIYCSGLIPILITSLILGYGYYNIHHVEKTEYSITTDKNIRSEGYSIAFLSDLHYGTTMNQQQLGKYCTKIEESKPDMLILGGDIVDENTSLEQMQVAFQTLSQVHTSYGIYYVYGNHDKCRYSMHPPFTDSQLHTTLEANKINILDDVTLDINDNLSITGRLDQMDAEMDNVQRKTSANLLENKWNNKFRILIDHQPCDIEENAKAGYDLMLSGHTHAGQIWPVGVLTSIFNHNTVNYGYKGIGRMNLVVSSGISGWGYPVRTEHHCEYVLIHINKQQN